ncbi:General secretion pathway protein F/type IV pilus assembly protein PilC [Pseudomonas sp. 8Z]|uniref:type II secretion system F family protein n=1 Tax=Pseudomonas sp. 8Z TaxID=2653166 RepID=UPI0012F2C768|nr:type II secretion system F family protein [Pseudomonas sp. 8Z]VXC18919.1 General secretion pathway protein F/type IV pilus assembly protein PilC [Pseudomonas sp. 8Z]
MLPSVAFLDLHERARLFEHLAAMEQAGVPVAQALASLTLARRHSARLQRLRQHVNGGRDLATSGQLSGVFTPLEVALLRAAQQAGALGHLHAQLAQRYAAQSRQARALKSRMLPPVGVLLLALAVKPLPALVAGTLSLVGYLAAVLLPLLLLFASLLLVRSAWRYWQRRRGQRASRVDDLLLALPLLGRMQGAADMRDFCDSFGLLLEAGVPVLDALPQACRTLANARLRREFASVAGRVAAGQSLVGAFQALSFPGKAMLIAQLSSAEAVGRPGQALLRFGQLQGAQLASSQQALAIWLPRLAYLAVAAWMAYALLTSGGFMPQLPAELAGR